MTCLKDDLVCKGLSDPFFLPVTLNQGEKCTPESIIHAIIREAVKEGCNIQLNASMFEKIKSPLSKMLDKLDDTRDGFKKIVDETSGSRESGRSVGWALEPHLSRLIPQDLVGGRANKKNLLRNFRKSYLFGKEDTVPLSLLIDGLSLKHMKWMKSLTSVRLKHCMMVALVKWLWRVSKRLLASCFYVSEMQASPNQLVYIPKRIWKAETDRAFNQFSRLQPLTAAEAARLAALRKPAMLRWMPKSEGLRPLVSVRGDKKSPEMIKAKDLVLSLFQRQKFQMNAKYKHSIWRQLVELHNQGRKLYFVACDICDAFGSIKQDKLIKIIEEEIIRQHGSKALIKFENEISNIKRAVKFQTVKRLKKSYHMTTGLAQGMPLSSPLCNLYLMHMDRTCLSDFTCSSEEKLIRVVDDYLYVTPDKTKAQRFLDTMSCGFDNYGTKIKLSKTQTNLESDTEILYCGYLINTANLEVYVRYNQGLDVSFLNSMVFKAEPILLLENKLVLMPLFKLNRLTLDRRYMTVEGVARNVLHTACVLARKLTAILALSRPCDTPDSNKLIDLVTRSSEAVAGRVCSVQVALARDALKMDPNESHNPAFKCLTKEEIKWIVFHAFSTILFRAAPMKRIPDDMALFLSKTEEDSKAVVRPQIVKLLSPVVNNIPSQFRNFDGD